MSQLEPKSPKYPIYITQEKAIHRITFKSFFHDAISAFNIERGLMYTLKLLFSQPGRLVDQYLFDGRFRVFNVFRLLLITTAISLMTMYFIGTESFFQGFSEGYNSSASSSDVTQEYLEGLFFDWYNLLLWLAIPVYGLISYLFNKKSGYNFAEHMVVQTFQICAINVISTIMLLLSPLFSADWLLIGLFLLWMVYYLWIFAGWMKKHSFGFICKNTLAFLIGLFLYSFILVLIVILLYTVGM